MRLNALSNKAEVIISICSADKLGNLKWDKIKSLPLPKRLAIAPATIRRVWGSSAVAAVIDSKLMPPWAAIRSWLVSVQTPNKVAHTKKKKRWINGSKCLFKLLVGKKRMWKFTIHCQICYGACCNSMCGFIFWVLKQCKQGRKSTCFYNLLLVSFCNIRVHRC